MVLGSSFTGSGFTGLTRNGERRTTNGERLLPGIFTSFSKDPLARLSHCARLLVVPVAANTITINKLPGAPADWAPGTNNDIEIGTFSGDIDLPHSDQPYRLHVGWLGGLTSLSLQIPITLNQNLFASQTLYTTVADLTGQMDFCTYFTVTSDMDMNLIPNGPVPEPSGLLALGIGASGLMGLAIRKRR